MEDSNDRRILCKRNCGAARQEKEESGIPFARIVDIDGELIECPVLSAGTMSRDLYNFFIVKVRNRFELISAINIITISRRSITEEREEIRSFGFSISIYETLTSCHCREAAWISANT